MHSLVFHAPMPTLERQWDIAVQLFAQPMAAQTGRFKQAERGIIFKASYSRMPIRERLWETAARFFAPRMAVRRGQANQAERRTVS